VVLARKDGAILPAKIKSLEREGGEMKQLHIRRIQAISVYIFVMVLCLTGIAFAADYETTYYKLIVPENNSRDWAEKVSKDLISIDGITYTISQEVAVINQNKVSRDAEVARLTIDTAITFSNTSSSGIGGIVGRIPIVSADGTTCYVPIYLSA